MDGVIFIFLIAVYFMCSSVNLNGIFVQFRETAKCFA